MAEKFEVVVFGGGTGGYPAAIRAAQLGKTVALIERDKVGGTCLHRGCIPTKAFLESAHVLHVAEQSKDFGIQVGNPTFDYKAIFARKSKIVDQLWKGTQTLLQRAKVTTIQGNGRITAPGKLVVEGEGPGREIEYDNLIIATGSTPRTIPGLEFDGKSVISSDHITMDLQTVPKSIIVLGAGAVGVEFASMYRDFGAEVTLVEMAPSVVPLEDREVGQLLSRSFARRGIKVLVGAGARPETFQKTKDGVSLEVGSGDSAQKLTAEVLLVAVGRAAITQDIGLENLKGVEVERGLIKVDGLLRTGEKNVYAVGDVVGGYQLAHKAMAEGMLAAEVIAGESVKPIDRWRVPRATYCRPEIGSMGMSEDEAKAQGYKVKTAKFNFGVNGRAMIHGETEGFVKMISDADTGEILGTYIIGPGATELIGETVIARYLEATPLELGLAIHAHPTLSEVLGEVALDVEGRPLHIAH